MTNTAVVDNNINKDNQVAPAGKRKHMISWWKPSLFTSAFPKEATWMDGFRTLRSHKRGEYSRLKKIYFPGKQRGLPVGASVFGANEKAPVVFSLNGEKVDMAKAISRNGSKKPLVLAFGSYTCPVWRGRISEMRKLSEEFGEQVDFLTVYIAEAHPNDEWVIPDNFKDDAEYNGDKASFCFNQARSLEERMTVANRFVKAKSWEWPVLLDNMDNEAMKKFQGYPIRLYVISEDVVKYTGKWGPFKFMPSEVKTALQKLL